MEKPENGCFGLPRPRTLMTDTGLPHTFHTSQRRRPMTTFRNLFSPISINTLSLPNRIVMTAMHLGYTPEGEVTDRLVDFYVARAKGGAGLIIVGGCPVDEYGGMSNMVCLHHDRFMPGLRRLTGAVKQNGSRIAA